MKKDIIYPIFLKLASTMEDTFWKYIYEDLSYGKCPYGIYLQNDYICCFIKGKEFSYHMDEKNKKSCEEIHHLLKYKAGILSEKEKQSFQVVLNQTSKQTQLNTGINVQRFIDQSNLNLLDFLQRYKKNIHDQILIVLRRSFYLIHKI